MVAFLSALFLLLLYQTAIQSMGNSLLPTIGGILEMLCRILTVLLLVGIIDKWAIYLSEVIGWFFCAVFFIICYRYVFRRRCRENGVSSKDGCTPIE